jgi:dTDP-4-dehydrorhamnose reductase
LSPAPKIAVFGANGQLGQDLLRLGAARGADIFGVNRPTIDALDPAVTEAGLKDLSFDVAVNCVAATRVDDCERDPGPAVLANAHFAERLARACQRNTARLVQVSTDYVFGGQAARAPLAESEARAPLNVYGATKALGEDLARCESDDVLVVRVASLFGVAGASGKGGNFVETMVRLGRERGQLKVVADQHMSPTSSHDAGEAILDLIAGAAPSGTYHLVNSGAATWFEFAQRIIERAGVDAEVLPITTQDFPTPARRPGYSVLSNALIQSTLGRDLPHWTDGLDRYLTAKGYR